MRLYEIATIDLNKFRYYHQPVERHLLEQELKEIERIFAPYNFTIRDATNIFEKSTKMPDIKIDGLQMYGYESMIELILILYDEDKNQIAAFAGFQQAAHIRTHLYQAKNVKVFSPYEGKALIGKIYKFAKERMNMSIQSDFEQTAAGEKLWTQTLPKLGVCPKIVDTDTGNVYDNDGKINVYDGTTRYCWIIEYNDYYRNQIQEGSMLMPYGGYYLTNDKTQYNSPLC